MEPETINGEQEMIIEELEKVVTFLKTVHVKNEEAIIHIKKPLDDLKSCLKYLPTGPSFNDLLPTEIKVNILSSLCFSNAFVAAAVCQEWKEITKSRFNKKLVTIGNSEDDEYVDPAEMLKASLTHKMDVHLFIESPIMEVDSKLVGDALTGVSGFIISGQGIDYDLDGKNTILSNDQLKYLIEGLEKSDKVMEKVELLDLDLNDLNQERLTSCLVNKVNKLMIDLGTYSDLLDVGTFINKLQDSTGGNLSHLTLNNLFLDSEDSCFDMADALCNIESVSFDEIEFALLKRLVKNIITCTRPIAMKTLIIQEFIEFDDFDDLISPEDMINMFNKMEKIQLRGSFNSNQLEAVKSIPGVTIASGLITKGSSEML